MSTSGGLTGALKNSIQKRFSARVLPRTRRSCGQIKSKSHQNLQAWSQGTCEHIHGRNRWITPWFRRNRRNPKQDWGFSRTPKLQLEEDRESEGFRARQDGLGTTQGVTKSSRSNPSSWVWESTKENRNHSKQSTKRTRLSWIQNPGGHKEDWASFPTQSQYKVLKNPYL